jgi:hypothetical protein
MIKGCKEPELVKHALIYYDGTKTGDIRLYNCHENYDMIGYSSSVCMIYGEWSHKAPKCKGMMNKI